LPSRESSARGPRLIEAGSHRDRGPAVGPRTGRGRFRPDSCKTAAS